MAYKDIPEIYAIYHGARWHKVRKLKIASVNGLCERCLQNRIFCEGKIVHHKIPITDKNWNDESIVYDLNNLEFLCDSCHKEMHPREKELYFDENGDYVKRESYGKERYKFNNTRTKTNTEDI